jgi:transposase
MTQNTILTAGIDTSKSKLDAAIHGQARTITVANTAAGWKTLAAHFARHAVQRVGIEATGGYERGVKLGRRPKLTPHQMKEAIKRHDRGDETLREIARSYNVSHSTISRLSS